MQCEECEMASAEVLCLECDQALCPSCNSLLHRGGKRKQHLRLPLCTSCRSSAISRCDTCQVLLCNVCIHHHTHHKTRPLPQPKRLGVFWDFSSCRPASESEIVQSVLQINTRLGKPEFIRTYGDPWGKWRSACISAGAEVVSRQGVKDSQTLLIDISLLSGKNLTDILLISGQAHVMRAHLMQLKMNLPTIKILVSSRILPLQPELIQELNLPEFQNSRFRQHNPSRLSEVPEFFKPQDFNTFRMRIDGSEQVIQYLKEQAYNGIVTHQLGELVLNLSGRLNCSPSEAQTLINKAIEKQIILVTKREFKDNVVFQFGSLRLKQISLECLLWTLRSLKVDEMLPTQKAIQARLKETFDLKPTQSQWHNLIKKARGHVHSNSAPVPDLNMQGYSTQVLKFDIREMSDPSGGSDTLLVYPKGEQWVALDQHSKYGDFLGIKDSQEWKLFLHFIENYFTNKSVRRPKKEEEIDSIPGGRYGCAQLVKLCGPNLLKEFSLGKLSYIVQLAINDDLLRYQRTSLIWTNSQHRSTEESVIQQKVQLVQKTIVNLLSQHPQGLSLAQMPLHLKRSLSQPVDITELGFAKLKDLLNTIPEVAIQMRGSSHPYAYLKRKPQQPFVEDLIEIVYQNLKKNRFGLSENSLEKNINESLRMVIQWEQYGVNSLSQFAQTYGKQLFDCIQTNQNTMMFLISDDAFSSLDSPKSRRVLNLSNIPDFNSFDLDSRLEQNANNLYSLLDVDEDFSQRLTGSRPPKYRTDSVSYNSNNSSRQTKHSRAQSQVLMNDLSSFHRQNYSLIDNLGIRPPPGFGDTQVQLTGSAFQIYMD